MDRASVAPSRDVIPALLDVVQRPRMPSESWGAVDLLDAQGALGGGNADVLETWAQGMNGEGSEVLGSLGEPGLRVLAALLRDQPRDELEAALEAAERGIEWRKNAWTNARRSRCADLLEELRESLLGLPAPENE